MLEELQHEITNLSCFQSSIFYASITIFNSVPHSLTILKNDKAKFKAVLRKYLNTHSFYYEGWNFNSGNYLFTTDTK